MRYFVTGGTGFIGRRLVRRLLAGGHEVVALVRDLERARDLEVGGAELAVGDITARDTLRAPMQGVDGVYHLAAWYEVGTYHPRAVEINVEGTRHVLEIMRELGIENGVYTSTLAVNSDTKGQKVDESYRYDGPHLSLYDETKWRAHHEVAVPFMQEGLPLVVVMPGLVYGPGDESLMGRLLSDAIRGRIVTLPGGKTGFCWSHVDDVVEGHLLAMERGRTGEAYIIAGPCHTTREGFEAAARAAGVTLRAVWVPPSVLGAAAAAASILEKVIPLPPQYSSEALRVATGTTYYGDNSKAKRELGYEPRSLEEGFASVARF